MRGLIDQKIESALRRKLYKQREKIIAQSIDCFIKEHHPDPTLVAELRRRLEEEADRVYAIVDRSVLRAWLKRAKYTFWIMTITTSIVAAVLAVVTHGAAVVIIAPILSAFVTWVVTVGTVPITYNERVKGGMDAVIIAFQKTLTSADASFNLKQSKKEIEAIKQTLVDLISQVNTLSQLGSNSDVANGQREGNLWDFPKIIAENSQLKEQWMALQTSLLLAMQEKENTQVKQQQIELDTQKNKTDIQDIKETLVKLNEKIDRMNDKMEVMFKTQAEEKVVTSLETKNQMLDQVKLPKKHNFSFWRKLGKHTIKKESECGMTLHK